MKILVADDDVTTRALLRAHLAKCGYEVEMVEDGEAAWLALQRPDAPRFAILDWLMPRLNGVEVCRRVRHRDDAHYIYIILLTAMDRLDDLVEGMEAGADDYVFKPFDHRVLQVRLNAGRRIIDLQNKLLSAQKTLEIQATHDSLTGLWNRKAILETLSSEIARSRREGTSVGLVLLDLDNFKKINDSYGHRQGDAVLRETSKRMTEAVRVYDSVGRFGGEEFLIVAPGCDVADTFRLAERVCQKISTVPMTIAQGSICVTGSLGVAATGPGQEVDPSDLIEAADRALYRAKAAGGKRVEWLSGTSQEPIKQEIIAPCKE